MRFYALWRALLGLSGLYLVVGALQFYTIGLTYQTSSSMQRGWYATYPIVGKLKVNDIVLFKPALALASYLQKQGWLLPNAWIMKHIVAVPGDLVCLKQQKVWVNGRVMASILCYDKHQQPLPRLSFCRHLAKNEYWLMSLRIPNSFDSRYFGPVLRSQLLAKSVKL